MKVGKLNFWWWWWWCSLSSCSYDDHHHRFYDNPQISDFQENEKVENLVRYVNESVKDENHQKFMKVRKLKILSDIHEIVKQWFIPIIQANKRVYSGTMNIYEYDS